MTGLYTDWRRRRGTCLWEVSVLLWPEENKFTIFYCFLSLEGMSLPFWYFRIFPSQFTFLVLPYVLLCSGTHLAHRGGGRGRCPARQGSAYAYKIWNSACGAMDMSRVRILNPPPSRVEGSTAAVLCCWSCLPRIIQLSHAQCQCSYNLSASKQV